MALLSNGKYSALGSVLVIGVRIPGFGPYAHAYLISFGEVVYTHPLALGHVLNKYPPVVGGVRYYQYPRVKYSF